MSKTFVFAIGGTGARVLRSLTMLMATGLDELNGTTICPVIIDYDERNGDKSRAIESMRRYKNVRDIIMATNETKVKDVTKDDSRPTFFSPELEEVLPNWSWNFGVDDRDNNKKYRTYIGYDNLLNYSLETRDLINSLYDTDNNSIYTELDLNMTQGFQGNPNIGSVVFDKLKDADEFNRIFGPDSFQQGDRIVIIGSIFGGTGSSGIPKLVSAIRNHNSTNVTNANLSVVLVLPYFAVGTTEEISIKSNIFNSKTKAALNFYSKSNLNGLINSIYYVGDKEPTQVDPCIGDVNQKNNAHIVELISAMAVAHFVSNGNANEMAPRGQMFKFNAADNITDGIGFKQLVGQSSADWDNNILTKHVVHNLINFVYSTRYFLDEIVEKSGKRWKGRQFYNETKLNTFDNKKIPSNNNDVPIQDYCAALYKFICKDKPELGTNADGFWQWLEELHADNHRTHRLKIFDLGQEDIVDILCEVNFRSKPAKYAILKADKKNPLFTYDNAFDSEMNNLLVPYRSGQKQVDVNKESLPWILNDLLSKMPEQLRITDTSGKLVPEIFKLVP